MLPGTAGIIPALATIAVLTVLSLLLVRQWGADPTLWTGLGVPYVGLPALALVVLRDDANWGLLAILWILFIVWAADTFAYFAGRIIGGPKLAPAISPKKTWAGLGGAMAGAALLSAVIAWFAVPGSIGPLMVLAAVLAVVEQGGDLFESSLKRHFGAKDSGDLIPGHGGAIDRVDGLVAVAVAAALIGFLRGGPLVAQGLLHW
jgi:phosphatidate cytidylyltransferase